MNQVQKYTEIAFLLFLLAGNTFSLYNSFAVFHFQYNRQPEQREALNQQFDYLTNGYNQSTFWFYMNIKLGFNLLSELVLFIIISLKVSDQKYKQYYIVQMVLVILQLVVSFQNIWPFSSHSKYGFDFEKKKRQILLTCSEEPNQFQYHHSLVCNFSESLFFMIKCTQALIIIAFISLSGISASSFLKTRYPQVLSERIKSIRSSTVSDIEDQESNKISFFSSAPKKLPNGMIPSRTVTINKLPDSITVISKPRSSQVTASTKKQTVEQVKQEAKKNSKIRRPSFWSNSYARTEASSSQAEDSQSDIDHSWQPSYITFSDSKKNIYSEQSNTFDQQSNRTSYQGYQPPAYGVSNPRLNIHKHYLDRSLDEDQLDIEENKQL
ncbi:hypothetical protein ABPG72_018613 [Tetrahymena utriculariae]